MKKYLFTLVLMAFAAFNGFAQDDDVYFVPSKKAKNSNVSSQAGTTSSSYEVISSENDDYWYEGRTTGRDVDEYNRRGTTQTDEVQVVSDYDNYGTSDDAYSTDGTYTARIVRFHAPGAVIVASPWYWDYYDTYFYDPWYGYSWRSYYGLYNPWGWSWNIGWSYPYYGWNYGYYGWHRPYYGWYDPWRYGYGWGRPYHGYNSWAWRPAHHGPAYTDYRRGWGSGRNLGGGRNGRRDNFGFGGGRSGGRYSNSSTGGTGGRLGGGTRTVEPGQRGRLGNSNIGTGSHSLGSRPTVNNWNVNDDNSRPVRSVNGTPSMNNSNNNGRTGVTTTGNSNRGRSFGGGTQSRSSSSQVQVPARSSSSGGSSSSSVSGNSQKSSTSSGSGRSFGSSSSSSGRSFGSGSSSSSSGRSFGGSSGSHSSGGGRGFGGRR